MRFENTEVYGFQGALRGMRNPKNSWDKSDSSYCVNSIDESTSHCSTCPMNEGCTGSQRDIETRYIIGKNDMKLAQQLIKAGSEHRKFMRQIFVSVDITAPLYWWKEFDTYKVGTVANSTSTMHKLATTPITLDCFETDDYDPEIKVTDSIEYNESDVTINALMNEGELCMIDCLEQLRQRYIETKDKKFWKELIRWLPESWLQTRTVTMSYENLLAMCSKGQRRFHRLSEWSESFINWSRTLPYSQELIFLDEMEEND